MSFNVLSITFIFLKYLSLIMMKISSAQLTQGFEWIVGSTVVFWTYITASARNPDIGEPIGVPLICLRIAPLNWCMSSSLKIVCVRVISSRSSLVTFSARSWPTEGENRRIASRSRSSKKFSVNGNPINRELQQPRICTGWVTPTVDKAFAAYLSNSAIITPFKPTTLATASTNFQIH